MSKPVGMPSQLYPVSGWQLGGIVWHPATVHAIWPEGRAWRVDAGFLAAADRDRLCSAACAITRAGWPVTAETTIAAPATIDHDLITTVHVFRITGFLLLERNVPRERRDIIIGGIETSYSISRAAYPHLHWNFGNVTARHTLAQGRNRK